MKLDALELLTYRSKFTSTLLKFTVTLHNIPASVNGLIPGFVDNVSRWSRLFLILNNILHERKAILY